MKLTRENVEKIFRECEWPLCEWQNEILLEDELPEGAMLLNPLPSGANVITFHPEKLNQYRQEIGELLDQIPYLSQETGITLPMLGHTAEGSIWSENIYVIQKLYLLGVATDQLLSDKNNETPLIYRIPKEKSIHTLVMAEKKKGRVIGKVINQQFVFNHKK